MLGGSQEEWSLERAVFDTVRYFDIFAMPVTAVQIWRSLIVDSKGAGGVRWHGQHVLSLGQVKKVLQESSWLNKEIENYWGYYCLKYSANKGKRSVKQYVKRRLYRNVLAQHKWKITRRVVWLLAMLPYVRMIGVTGSLALNNTRRKSDLDLLIIVKRGRIWMARIFVLLVTQLTGRRRKYWDREAPDKVCLNHYITDDAMMMSLDIHNLYTAMLYNLTVPLMGRETFQLWRDENGPWMKRWLMYSVTPLLSSRHAIITPMFFVKMKKIVEGFLSEPIGELLERGLEKMQRRVIWRHKQPGWDRRVNVSNQELAFHPDSKELQVLHKFNEEYGQGLLL
jgi:hypothetical protein